MLIRSKGYAVIVTLMLASCKQSPPIAQTRPDTVRVEGEAVPTDMHVYQPKSSVPFRTYVPDGMIAESRPVEGCEAHYFIANFAGKRNDDAYLMICMLPAGVTQDSAIAQNNRMKASLERKGIFTRVSLKMHNLRYYMIVEHYPVEYGDGIAPRLQKIQDSWEWLDVS